MKATILLVTTAIIILLSTLACVDPCCDPVPNPTPICIRDC